MDIEGETQEKTQMIQFNFHILTNNQWLARFSTYIVHPIYF